ncbi:MAG: hypothetical protein V4864_04795 [Pseudomonadota bacterium]
MNIDIKELDKVAAAQAPRFDMYGGIHKALRALMADTLLAVGRMDCEDNLELAQTTERVMRLLDICAGHLKHENDFIHAAIEARAPGASDRIGHEHAEHLRHIAQLGDTVAALRAAPADRAPLAKALYAELSLFIAENFQHMHVEETAHNAVLWARYTDAELVAIHDALVASIPPEEMMFTVRWLVPCMNPAERLGLLSDIRGKAPAPAFEAMLNVVRPHLGEGEWAKLARGLGLPVAPGLATA